MWKIADTLAFTRPWINLYPDASGNYPNNPNYAGTWLNVIWPFCIAILLDKREYIFQRLSVYFFTIGISLTTVLTNSRSAWLGIFIGSLLMFGRKSFSLMARTYLLKGLMKEIAII